MNNTLKIILIVSGVLLVAAGLLIGGIVIGRTFFAPPIFARSFGPGMMGSFMDRMDNYHGNFGPGMMWNQEYQGEFDRVHGPGMMWDENYQGEGCPMESYGHGPGMMWQEGFDDEDCPMHGDDFGHGMMWDENYQGGFGHGHGPGMMWQFTDSDEDLPILTIEQVEEALAAYLLSVEDENLAVKEIMIFSNHAYAEIVEEDTGIGAFEVLIDPVSLDVYPEHGPNMMWNLKYGMHGSFGYDEAMTVSPEEAVSLAQEYLDANSSGLQVDDHTDTFYGYYTLHTLKDGEVVGMLSVNGYTGDVFVHTWHGDFVEMSEDAH